MWSDNQFTTRNTQTTKHEIEIDGVKTVLYIKRGPCEGVKRCSGDQCCYIVSNRQKINRCSKHKQSCPLVSTGNCNAQMIYVWPEIDNGKRWVGLVPGTQHNHPKPAPHIMSSKVKEDLQKVVEDDISKSTKDLMKGLGLEYVPGEASAAAANADRIRRERKLALNKSSTVHKDLRPLDEILKFDKIRKKVESSQLDDNGDSDISTKVNEMIGQYQLEGCEYIFTPNRKYAFFMAPFQASLLSKALDLFVDITYTGNDFFPYLLNMVTLNEHTCVYNAVARVLCSRQDGESYASSIRTIFGKVTKEHSKFRNGANLRSILVDFDDAKYKGFEECLGEELTKKVLRGCSVHWMRSVNRVCKLICKGENEDEIFKALASSIKDEDSKDNVILLFQVLSGEKGIDEAIAFLPDHLKSISSSTSNHHWKKLKFWAKWWCRLNHLAMFTRAYKEMADKDWDEGPKTTNPVEALNRQSFKEGSSTLHALLENIYLEDRVQAVKIAASNSNVTTSYIVTPSKQRKRKRTSMGSSTTEGRPDKRRDLRVSNRKKNGRALINGRIEVEYAEKDQNGDVTKYWGWCKGK